MSRSRGSLSTQLHLAARGLGCPVRLILTAGHRGDAPQAKALPGKDRQHLILGGASASERF